MLEDLIGAVGLRHGFRASDFRAVWDGGQFDASRDTHELVIKSKDGRQELRGFRRDAMRDPWKNLGEIEAAFRRLSRRRRSRGI